MRYHSITALMHQTLKLETDSTVEIQVLLKPKIFFESVSHLERFIYQFYINALLKKRIMLVFIETRSSDLEEMIDTDEMVRDIPRF